MLEINLAPPEVKKKRRKRGLTLKNGFSIPMEIVVGAVGGLLMLLVGVHILLLVINITKVGQVKVLKGSFSKLSTQKKQVDDVLSELRSLQGRKQSIDRITGNERVFWSKKLNLISDLLPPGVWLIRVNAVENVLSIQGRAISRQEKEMINVHTFVSKLKNSKDFMEQIENLELGRINMIKLNGVDVADFLIKVNGQTVAEQSVKGQAVKGPVKGQAVKGQKKVLGKEK